MQEPAKRTTTLPSGEAVPVLGQGTWNMGARREARAQEVAALKLGLDLGMTLVDTAEMYADGGAEEVAAEAMAGRRDEVFLVTKVLPNNATSAGTVAACERSLRRLRTDRIDLYLLHWRGGVPLGQTLAGFEKLLRAGKIRHWGVSNLDVADLEELTRLPSGDAAASNQVLYNLKRRRVEYELLPWCRDRSIPVMAYSPIEQGRLLAEPTLVSVARRLAVSPAQVALAWILREPGVIAIPKAAREQHARENAEALDLTLTVTDLQELDRAFPPPTGPGPLELL